MFVLCNTKWTDLITVHMYAASPFNRKIVLLWSMQWKSHCCYFRLLYGMNLRYNTVYMYSGVDVSMGLCAVFENRPTFHFRNSIDFWYRQVSDSLFPRFTVSPPIVCSCIIYFAHVVSTLSNMLIYYLNMHIYALCLHLPDLYM